MSGARLTRKQLYRMIWQRPLSSVAAELGMSAGGLAKICDRLDVPYPPRGYWARRRAGRPTEKPPLPGAPPDSPSHILLDAQGNTSRRTRLRKTPEERRDELKAFARRVIAEEGLHRMTMKHVAARIGMSEAQAHNYFTRDELLIEITRDELRAIEDARQAAMKAAPTMQERAVIGTQVYLRELKTRGAMVQDLLALPAVREGLRPERGEKSQAGVLRMTSRFESEHGVPAHVARNTTRILTALTLRAGRIVSAGQLDLPMTERLVLDIIAAGNARVIETWGSPKPGKTASARRSRR